MKKHLIVIVSVFVVIVVGAVYYVSLNSAGKPNSPITQYPEPVDDGTPNTVTISGSFTCLPYLDTSTPQTKECTYGFKTDEGIYYSVNFGQSAESMQRFQNREHVTAEGFVVPKLALSTDHWNKYNMEGVFTITRILDSAASDQKLDIAAVCKGALAYMTFVDGASADQFVSDCIAGKHPEVIEQYKKNIGNDELM
jgi:hypothetical protein